MYVLFCFTLIKIIVSFSITYKLSDNGLVKKLFKLYFLFSLTPAEIFQDLKNHKFFKDPVNFLSKIYMRLQILLVDRVTEKFHAGFKCQEVG